MECRACECHRGKINGLKIPTYIIMKMVIGDFSGVVSERARLVELLKEDKMTQKSRT